MKRILYLIFLIYLFSATTNGLASSFTFATLGDTQDISDKGIRRLESLIEGINQAQPAFVIHIGELKGGSVPCEDEYYQRIVQTANRFESPLIYIPGDNDWTDCFKSKYDPQERLSYLRDLLYKKPISLGRKTMVVNRQSSLPTYESFPENVWWEKDGVLFATFHNVGTNNNLYTDQLATQEHFSRNGANLTWLDKMFSKAATAKALVLFTHANIKFGARSTDPTGFDSFRNALKKHVLQFDRPVLLVHGDSHQHRIDKPLQHEGQTITNFTRLEVFGSPDLGLIYVHVHPETRNVFHFEPVAVPLN